MKVRDNTIVLFYVFGFFFSNNGCNFDLNNYNDRLDTDTFYGPPQGPYKGRLTVLLLRFFMSLFFVARFQVVIGTVMQVVPATSTYGAIMFVSLISVLLKNAYKVS